MRFYINTAELNAGISTVVKALSAKTTVSILEGIYMEAANGSLLLRCTDLSLQIQTFIRADIREEGAIVLPGRLFSEMVRRLPGETTSFEVKKGTASIESGSFRTTLQGEDADGFHTMSTVNREHIINMRSDAFKNMIRQCIFAAAQDDTKPILAGALLEQVEGDLSIVALDGYRLAMRKEPISYGMLADRTAVIPARSLLEISKILPDSDDKFAMIFSRTHVMIDLEHTAITARLMDGEFIKYKQILPDGHRTRVRVNRHELMGGIERVALMAREGKTNLIKFSFAGDTLTVTANSELGRSKEEIHVDLMGEDIEIAFNAKYFTDVLKVLDDEEIYLDMINNISPCVVHPVQGSGYYYLILPVRLFSGM